MSLSPVSFSHPGRCRNDAAFAALADTSPLEASSGSDRPTPTQPRRRPGAEPRDPHHRHHADAQLPHHPRLRRTTHRRRKTSREIRRCLKHYIARQLYRTLTTTMTPTTQT